MATRKTIRILGIAGSLRTASTNQGLLRAAAASAQRINVDTTSRYHLNFRIHPGLRLPLYDGDLEAQQGAALESVQALRQAIANSDALLIATPEYNYSFPGVLKNAIDWASRPLGGTSPIIGKPAAIFGAAGVSGKHELYLRGLCELTLQGHTHQARAGHSTTCVKSYRVWACPCYPSRR